ncbi:Sensory transduction protein LytR [compost metagenome]
MINIAVVEDEAAYREQLKQYLQRFGQEKNEKIEIDAYSDGDQFVEAYKAQYDIILMDVQMPLLNGMSAAQEIRKTDSQVVIIFITNSSQYAIKGYAVDALDYVLKPISYFQFAERLNRAIGRMRNRMDHYITVKTKDGFKRFKVSDIYYVESQGHQLVFHMENEQMTTTGTMKILEEQLVSFHFFRGNKGFLINLQHVEGMDENCAIVKGDKLPISRLKRKSFMESLTDYWGEMIK